MKNKFVIINLALCLISSSYASNSFIPKFIIGDSKQTTENVVDVQLPEKCVNFTGDWSGICDDDSEIHKMSILQNSDCSQIIIENIDYPINALSSNEIRDDLATYSWSAHIHWNEDHQKLLLKWIYFQKYGSPSQIGFSNRVGTTSLRLDHGQLIETNHSFLFEEGELIKEQTINCVYKKP